MLEVTNPHMMGSEVCVREWRDQGENGARDSMLRFVLGAFITFIECLAQSTYDINLSSFIHIQLVMRLDKLIADGKPEWFSSPILVGIDEV